VNTNKIRLNFRKHLLKSISEKTFKTVERNTTPLCILNHAGFEAQTSYIRIVLQQLFKNQRKSRDRTEVWSLLTRYKKLLQ